MGEEVGHRGFGDGAIEAGEDDAGGGGCELKDGLAAGSAGRAGGIVEVDDEDGVDSDGWAVASDGGGDGRLFGAGG